jgi:hypothetical protein
MSGVAGSIVWAWILTIPAAATMSAVTYSFVGFVWPRLPGIAQVLVGVAVAAAILYGGVSWLRGARAGRLAHA